MKKIIFIILLSIIGIINVKASDIIDTFYYDTKVENMYITKVKDGVSKNGAPFLLHKSNGELVYCIEPFLYLDSGNYYGYKEFSNIFNISESAIEKMNLIAHYGYGYSNHSDLKWYGITQYLIWNELNLDDLYFTDSYYGNRIIAYTQEIDEMNNLINNHYILPNFDKVINIEEDKHIELTDSNNVLQNYEFETDNSSINIIDNKLVFDSLKEGEYNITFKKRENKEHYMLYYSDNGQNLLLPGKINDVETSIKVIVKSGKVNLKKHDIKNDAAQKNLTFKDTIYGVYDLNDNLVKEVTLDDLGMTSFKLDFGSYYIKEIKAPVGYLLDLDKHYFEINFDNSKITLDLYDEVISKKVIIKKFFGNSDTLIYMPEEGALFEIYDSFDNLVGTYTTNSNGIIELILPYGSYKIHQVSGLDNYTMSNDYNFDVTDTNDYEIKLYDNEIPIDVPDTYKDEIDYFGAISVLLVLFIFNLGIYAYRKNINYI